jgi:hypothetical protein
MTDAEKRAKAREAAAFLAGFRYAVGWMTEANMPLVSILAAFIWIKERGEDEAARAVLDDLPQQMTAVFDEVNRLRDYGGLRGLEFFAVEQMMAAER